MKVRLFIPKPDGDFEESELACETLPAVGAKIVLIDHVGLDLEVERVAFMQDQGALLPQLWLKDVGPAYLPDWISSLSDEE